MPCDLAKDRHYLSSWGLLKAVDRNADKFVVVCQQVFSSARIAAGERPRGPDDLVNAVVAVFPAYNFAIEVATSNGWANPVTLDDFFARIACYILTVHWDEIRVA